MVCIISVANQKGGVAKTTTAISLGAVLAWNGSNVLLVDTDAQANLTMHLGVDPASVRNSIANVLLSVNPIIHVIRSTSVPRLDLVPSNAEMELAERFLPIRKSYQIILKTALKDLPKYDFLIIDCPPSLGAVTTNALHASNLLIIPSQAEYFSIHALRSMLGFVKSIRKQGNPDLIYRILLTMYDGRNRIHRELRNQLQITFYEGLFQNMIGIDTKLRESSVIGLPITEYRPRSRSSLQYQALALELVQHVHEFAIHTT
ncbi:MAG: ParA family protein [Anaerolineales bacterium]|jgi:chromosome partitioning protein